MGVQDRPRVPRQISQGNRITGGKPKQRYLQATPTPFSVTGVRKTQLGRRQLGLQGPAPPQERRQHLGVERWLLGPGTFSQSGDL